MTESIGEQRPESPPLLRPIRNALVREAVIEDGLRYLRESGSDSNLQGMHFAWRFMLHRLRSPSRSGRLPAAQHRLYRLVMRVP